MIFSVTSRTRAEHDRIGDVSPARTAASKFRRCKTKGSPNRYGLTQLDDGDLRTRDFGMTISDLGSANEDCRGVLQQSTVALAHQYEYEGGEDNNRNAEPTRVCHRSLANCIPGLSMNHPSFIDQQAEIIIPHSFTQASPNAAAILCEALSLHLSCQGSSDCSALQSCHPCDAARANVRRTHGSQCRDP